MKTIQRILKNIPSLCSEILSSASIAVVHSKLRIFINHFLAILLRSDEPIKFSHLQAALAEQLFEKNF